MEQLGKHTNRKGYVRTRPLYSMIHSPRTRARGSSTTSNGRIVLPGHVIQLRCNIAANSLSSEQPHSTIATGRLKSARLLPMGIVHGSNEEKRLGVVTARQAPLRASTVPAIPTSNAIVHSNHACVRRRVHSAIPSPRTNSMIIDDLLTISATDINMSRIHKRVHNQQHHQKEEDTEHKQDESAQHNESMATITDNGIKVKVVISGRQSRSKLQTELPTLPENHKQGSNHFNLTTNKPSGMKKCNSKLSPLTGAHSQLPIGTLHGNSIYLTCKNKSS